MSSSSRDDFEKTLRELIRRYTQSENQLENVSLIIWSKSQTGKTFIIERALESEDVRPFHITGSRIAICEASYFEEVFDAFCEAENYHRLDIDLGLSAGFSLFGFCININKQPSVSNTLCRKANLMASYLNEIDERRRSVFFIENLQRIDRTSVSLLKSLIDRLDKSFMIYELSDADQDAAIQYRKELYHPDSNLSGNQVIQVEPPTSAELVRIAKETTGLKIEEDCAAGVYQESNRSLTAFIDKCSALLDELPKKASVSFLEEVIICLIYLHGKPLETASLRDYLDCTDQTQFIPDTIEGAINALCAYAWIDDAAGVLSLGRSCPIGKCLESDKTTRTAAQAMIYRIKPKSSKSPEDRLRLARAQIISGDPNVVDSLEELSTALGQIRYTESFVRSAIEMTNALAQNAHVDVCHVERAFLDAFLECGDRESAKLYISGLDSSNALIVLYRFIVDVTEKDDSSIERQYHSLLATYGENKRLAFFVKLNMASYYMRFANRSKARAYLDLILADDDCSNYPEYYWAMKQRTVFLPVEAAFDDLEKCILYFETHGHTSTFARTRMTYALRLALAGDPAKAYEIFRSDFENQLDRSCPDCYYLNNIAACLLMLREQLEVAREMLMSSLMYPLTPYETTLVRCNLFASSLLLKDYQSAASQVSDLVDAIHSDHIAIAPMHACLTNLLAYCRQASPKAEEGILQELKQLKARCDETLGECIDAQIANEELPPSHRFRYITEQGFRPGFIGFWQMQVDRSLTDYLIEQIQ